jgi:hypothetical protein
VCVHKLPLVERRTETPGAHNPRKPLYTRANVSNIKSVRQLEQPTAQADEHWAS